MRSKTIWLVVALLLIAVIWFLPSLAHRITPVEMTHTAIGETIYRIHMHAKAAGQLPKSLAELPIRENYGNRVTDGWSRALTYEVDDVGILTIRSLGRDGKVGGVGEDEDVAYRYQTKDRSGKFIVGDELWTVEAEIPRRF
jgi:hypothetical protein